MQTSLSLEDIDLIVIQRLCGVLDENLDFIAKYLDIQISRQNYNFNLSGKNTITGKYVLEQLINIARNREVSELDIQLACVNAQDIEQIDSKKTTKIDENNDNKDDNFKSSKTILKVRKSNFAGRTNNQNKYINTILNNEIIFALGPAGTGKTYLAVACAVHSINNKEKDRIILVRPAVEAGEKLGFLPGDLAQKIDPYLKPIYDALYDLMGFDLTNKLIEKNLIEIAPLAYMRGRTLNNAFVILDEAQNTTPQQMKMFLTRIGQNSKAIITGDITQIDLPNNVQSGLNDAISKLKNISEIKFHYFNTKDIVRHRLVQKIIEAYDNYDH